MYFQSHLSNSNNVGPSPVSSTWFNLKATLEHNLLIKSNHSLFVIMWIPRKPGCSPDEVTLCSVSPASGLQLFTIINFPPFIRTSWQFSKTLIISSSVKITNKFLTMMVSTSVDCGTSFRIFPIVNVIRLSGIPSFAKNFLEHSITSEKSNRTPLTCSHPGNLSMIDKNWPSPPLMSMIRIHLPQGYKVKTLGCGLSSSSSLFGHNYVRIRTFIAVNPLLERDSPLLLLHDHTPGYQFCSCSRRCWCHELA